MLNLLILAQDFEFDLGGSSGGADAAGAIAGLVVMVIGLLIYLGILAVICFLLYGCFQRIPQQHRQMESWHAWLLMIPLFNLVWNFFVLPKLARSYQGYFGAQGRADVGDCGEKIGLWCAICWATTMVSIIPCIGWIVGGVAWIAGLVLLIMYLVKALTLKGQIPQETM